ncbi:MAG: hypothetical protein PHY71_08075, partial [Bacteroidaceae bacterium]|nr:hypothetical protein [Bacteroidaceae bacterium]
NLSSYFTTVGEQALTAANSFKEAGDMAKYSEYLQKAGQAAALAGQTADKNLDCDQSGWGLTPIIGFDYKIGKFNFGAKYEFNTHMNIENQTKVDDTGLFADGVNTPHDIPALLAFGATYEILPTLRISAGYHHFFDKSASMASNKQEHLTKGTNEFLGGIEYDVCPWAQVSIGIQSTDYGLSDAYMNDMSFATDSYSIGFGAGFMLSKAVKLNVAYFFTNYEHYNKTQADFSGTGLPYQEDFTRDNKVVGVGVNYKF